jgi:hypothetical protein
MMSPDTLLLVVFVVAVNAPLAIVVLPLLARWWRG